METLEQQSRCFIEQDTLPSLVVGSRNEFDLDFTIEVK